VDSPHLRIASDQVWERAQARLAMLNTSFSKGRAAGLSRRSYTAKYLFSGFLKCGLCGSNIVLIPGRGGAGWVKYGCPLHQNRGICSNALFVRRDTIERELISGLSREVLREDLAAYAIEEFKRQLQARLVAARSHLEVLRARRVKLKAQIANLAGAVADGHSFPALFGELGKRERELEDISEQLLAAD
jgi:site-specific DNA recombinase